MDPELVKQADRLHGQHHHWPEANQGEPGPEYPADERARPALAQGGRQVVSLGRVMHYMRRPEQPALMARAVEPVVAEFVAEEKQPPHPPLIAERENPETIDRGEDRELHR